MTARMLAASLLAALIASCGARQSTESGDSAPIPLPRAWPRTALYDTIYTPATEDIEINASALVDVSHDCTRIDAVYPAYRATLYVTDTRAATVDEADAAEANRIERMSLNTGGLQSEQTTVNTPAGYKAVVLVTPVGSPTPVQFMARAPRRVVSGAVVLDRITASADSVAPTLAALRLDLLHLITSLR